MNAYFLVELVKLQAPIGDVEHALLKCPRCLKGIGVTKKMLAGRDSIICNGMLGETGRKCGGHYYFDLDRSSLRFVGTQDTPTKTYNPYALQARG